MKKDSVLKIRNIYSLCFRITNSFMQIIWQNENLKSQYAFRNRAEWSGLTIHHAQVMPGRMVEHFAEYHEINIPLAGKLTTERISPTGQRKRYKYTNGGGICITPAGQTIGAFWDKEINHLGMFFAPDFVAKTAAENRFSPKFDFFDEVSDKDPLVQHIGLTLLDEYNNENREGNLYAESLINTLTLHLLKNYSNAVSITENTHGGLSGYKLNRVKEFICANLEEDLSLADLAAIADLSQFHFARAFRKSTGFTPQHFVTEQRIERAKKLLAEDDLPIVEVGLQTGFKNQSHFTTLFRKYTKFTPKSWRELKLA